VITALALVPYCGIPSRIPEVKPRDAFPAAIQYPVAPRARRPFQRDAEFGNGIQQRAAHEITDAAVALVLALVDGVRSLAVQRQRQPVSDRVAAPRLVVPLHIGAPP